MRLIARSTAHACRPRVPRTGAPSSGSSLGTPPSPKVPTRGCENAKDPMSRPARRWRRVRRFTLTAELVVLALAVSASNAHAETMVVALAASVTEVINNVRNWIMGILAALATVFLTIGGVRYVVGGGDPGEVEKAKTAFKSAGWGYGLAALAPLVVEILKGIVGA